ncbi:hypothetical protein [Ideonella sp. YS5]|uniref:hypothetical protein n=1 Tax=Ideonella sp. YS5 TaxID=3453714 RepID=UPI003EEBDCD8
MRQFTLAFALALACALVGLMGASLAHARIGDDAGMAPAAMGQDARLQRPAASTLPTVLQHLQTRQPLHAPLAQAPACRHPTRSTGAASSSCRASSKAATA